jgi:hypothetical protein
MSADQMLFTDLTLLHLRFEVEAATLIEMGEYKGSALRGAWKGQLQRAYCGASPAARQDPLHQAVCPVCYLTERETGPESRRPYAIQPPLSRQARYEPGEPFAFGLTLFGNALTLFPYVLLSMREMGEEQGIGRYLPSLGGRGRFRLLRVKAYDPHSKKAELLYDHGDNRVKSPTLLVTDESVAAGVRRILASMAEGADRGGNRLTITHRTPLRLIQRGRLMRRYEFPIFFQRLLERLYGLGEHFSQNPAAYNRQALKESVERLMPLARQVQIADNRTRWWDVQGYSNRLHKKQHLGGLVGQVTLESADWTPLLPYILWGESVQVGKNIVKGSGWFGVAG